MAEIDPLGNPEPTYLQVANAIATRIKAGHYRRKLPSERDLAREYRVSYQTQRHAMQVLRTRGLIITRQGRGTFIAPDPGPASPPMGDARTPAPKSTNH